jgi:hypothetical protein
LSHTIYKRNDVPEMGKVAAGRAKAILVFLLVFTGHGKCLK